MRIGISALNIQSAAGHAKAGISRYCTGLIEGLREIDAGHEYVIIAGPGFEPSDEWRGDPRLTFVPPTGPFLGNKMLREIFMGRKWVRDYRLDAYLSTAHALAPVALEKRGIVVHDLFPATHPELFSKKDAFAITRVNAWSMKRASVVIANSRHTKSEIMRINAIPDAKIKVVPLGLGNLAPLSTYAEVDVVELGAMGVPFNRFIVTIGTLEPRKNLPRLIEAFARISESHPGLGLAIAGAKGWKEHSIFDSVRFLGIEDRIAFLGYVPDEALPKLFARCEFFVCPSLVEGFGMPVLEAMHYGAPVVTSSGGALAEVAPPESIFFDPFSVDDIAHALESALGRNENRAEIVIAGQAAASQYSWARTARETLQWLLA